MRHRVPSGGHRLQASLSYHAGRGPRPRDGQEPTAGPVREPSILQASLSLRARRGPRRRAALLLRGRLPTSRHREA